MKSTFSILGIALILLGIVALGYQGISYTEREPIADIGGIHVTADTQKTIFLSPVLGGASLVAGIILVLVGRRDKN